ncbi:VCBS repeat-containing protein, partial [bacterium]|nr:VCBS repeat-containing protein [bacterium]
MDQDGASDVVTLPEDSNGNRIDVWYGAGDGTFPRTRGYPLPSRPYDVEVRDLDGDGRNDIVAVVSPWLHVLWGTGGREFAGESYSGEANHNWMALSSIAIGDVSGDGRLDVLTVRWFQLERINVFLGARPHQPARALRMQELGYGAGHYPRAIVLEDLDGDGDLDVATANGGTKDVSVLLGTVATDAKADVAPLSLHGFPEGPVAADDDVIGLGRPFPSPFRDGSLRE